MKEVNAYRGQKPYRGNTVWGFHESVSFRNNREGCLRGLEMIHPSSLGCVFLVQVGLELRPWVG